MPRLKTTEFFLSLQECVKAFIFKFFLADELLYSFNTSKQEDRAVKGNRTLRTLRAIQCVTLNIVLVIITWNQQVYHRIQNSPQIVSVLIHTNSVHTLQNNLFEIYFNIISHLLLGPPSDLFLEVYPEKSYMHVSSLPYIPLAPPRLVVLDLRTIIIVIIITLSLQ